MPLEEFIIFIFCYIDDQVKKLNIRLRSRGFAPTLTTSEVITIETVGAFLGLDTDKALWLYFHRFWRHFFPHLPHRTTFIRHSTNLWRVKQIIQQQLTKELGTDNIHIIDGFPLPVCHFRRACRSSCFRGEANFGSCTAKRQPYYGFKGHLVITVNGVIENFALTPASIEEHQVLEDLTEKIEGLLLADKGYLGKKYKRDLLEKNICLETPLKKNMQDPRPALFVQRIKRTRKIIESVIAQLIYRFKILRIWARDRYHLVNRLSRIILAHTMGVFINRKLGRSSIVFDGLIT